MNCKLCCKDTTNPTFCSRSCAATFNNKHKPKRKRERSCSSCDTLVRSGRKYCPECFKTKCISNYADMTIEEFSRSRGSRNSYHTTIRQHAVSVAKVADLLKSCKVCGYSFCVQCCHIKAIASFPKTTKLKVVNSIDNLVGLCPNHHVELDRGYINLT